MRTTVNIRDSLLDRLKAAAERSGESLTEIVNRTLEVGLDRVAPSNRTVFPVLPSFSMGEPTFNLDKASRLAAELEDEEILRKLRQRK